MTIINPDHEAAIAAFHRAAALAGTGGDGRYARAVVHLEPSVRRDLEARAAVAPQPPADLPDWPPQNWAGMDGAIAWHLIDRHADGWQAVGEMMAAWLAANVPQPPAEAQAQGSGEVVAEVLKTRCGCHPETCCCGDYTLRLNGKEVAKGFHDKMQAIADAINAKPTPPSAPVGVEGIDANDNADYIDHCADRLERLGHLVVAGGLRVIAIEHRTLAQQPAAVDRAAVERTKWVCGFCTGVYYLPSPHGRFCCDAQAEFRAAQPQGADHG